MSKLDVLLAGSLFFAPLLGIGIAGVWIAFRRWWPLAARLGISPVDRGKSHNLLFAGCLNASVEDTIELNKARRAYALLFVAILIHAFFFMGMGAVFFFSVIFLLNFFTARPLELPGKIQ